MKKTYINQMKGFIRLALWRQSDGDDKLLAWLASLDKHLGTRLYAASNCVLAYHAGDTDRREAIEAIYEAATEAADFLKNYELE